jgi:hypothetical protein
LLRGEVEALLEAAPTKLAVLEIACSFTTTKPHPTNQQRNVGDKEVYAENLFFFL